MNIHEKMCMAKNMLQESKIQKSGRNEFSKYDYFELSDFLPTIVQIQGKLKFNTRFVFMPEQAMLTITNCEDPADYYGVSCQMSTATLKGMHEIQNLGAVLTYTRRYLYVIAFDIVEHDAIDASPVKSADKPVEKPSDKKPAEKTKPESKQEVIDEAQYQALMKLCVAPDGQIDTNEAARLKTIYQAKGYQRARDIKKADYTVIKEEYMGHGLPFNL